MHTTLNIHDDILTKINFAAENRGISCGAMIVILLHKFVKDGINMVRVARLVQYQQRSLPEYWQPVHVHFLEDEYEYFLDLRKLLKMSVSLILAEAVKKYLNNETKLELSDNYRFYDYILIHELVDNIPCWKIYWGIPEKIAKYILLE